MSVQQVAQKIQRMMAEMFGTVSIDSEGDFFVVFDSATVFVRVFETSKGALMVRVFSIVLTDVPLGEDLYRLVATAGQDYFFGHMQVVEVGADKG
ncbi:MAG: T3SS (YopN, CesT) and YbjN peptide-binding chaperone 1, partial [Planctomycetaceae bacterium]